MVIKEVTTDNGTYARLKAGQAYGGIHMVYYVECYRAAHNTSYEFGDSVSKEFTEARMYKWLRTIRKEDNTK